MQELFFVNDLGEDMGSILYDGTVLDTEELENTLDLWPKAEMKTFFSLDEFGHYDVLFRITSKQDNGLEILLTYKSWDKEEFTLRLKSVMLPPDFRRNPPDELYRYYHPSSIEELKTIIRQLAREEEP
jgi:hypothetical protein